jgi:hypothetical protein
MSCRCDKDIQFFAVESILGFFFTVHSHKLITVKILEFYPAHFDLMVTNGLIYKVACTLPSLSIC